MISPLTPFARLPFTKPCISILLVVACLCGELALSACSCFPYTAQFCRMAKPSHHMVLGVVLQHPAGHEMDFKVLERLHQQAAPDTVRVLGQDGLNCGESLSQFAIGDTIIMALELQIFQGDTAWYLEGFCGLHFLRYANDTVHGQITDSLTSQSMNDFRNNLFQCLAMIPSGVEAIEEHLRIFPNPALRYMVVESALAAAGEVDIMSLDGHWIMSARLGSGRSVQLDLTDLPPGMYLAAIQTSQGLVRRQFQKQ